MWPKLYVEDKCARGKSEENGKVSIDSSDRAQILIFMNGMTEVNIEYVPRLVKGFLPFPPNFIFFQPN